MKTIVRISAAIALALAASACAPIHQLTRFHDALTPEEHVQLGMTYESQQLFKDAEREYRAAVGPKKRDVPGLLALGNLLFSQGRLKEAEQTLTRANRLAPDNKSAANNLAMVLASENKDLRKAEALARKATEDERLRPYAYDTLASIYGRQGRVDDAHVAVAEARKAAPADNPQFLEQLQLTENKIEPSAHVR